MRKHQKVVAWVGGSLGLRAVKTCRCWRGGGQERWPLHAMVSPALSERSLSRKQWTVLSTHKYGQHTREVVEVVVVVVVVAVGGIRRRSEPLRRGKKVKKQGGVQGERKQSWHDFPRQLQLTGGGSSVSGAAWQDGEAARTPRDVFIHPTMVN